MNISQAVQQLHKERKRVQVELGRLDAAISALSSNGSRGASSRSRPTMSLAARKRIAAAQRARWARWKAKQKKSA